MDSQVINDEVIIESLVAKNQIREDSLLRAQKISDTSGESVLMLMLKLGTLSDRNFADTLSSLLNKQIVEVDKLPEDVDLSELELSEKFLAENRLIPIAVREDEIDVVMADPRDDFLVRSLALSTGKKINTFIGLPQDIERLLEKLNKNDEDDEFSSFGIDENDIEHLKDLASEAPVIRQVNNIMQNAVEQRASDIHIEPFENRMKVRYRIDGVMIESETLSAQSSAAIISRIKIMAKLNIAERRLPQDGRIQFRVQGKELDLRVSTVPTLYGESVVMRILDREQVVLDFSVLGFEGEQLKGLLKALQQPHGIILVTGPTGSGKSTTLYTALSTINTSTRKIITAEDPVEYQIEGINQIQVKAQIGLTFAAALRSIVRQDPDVIMVGEMRDLETAQIAVQSALTGHLVLSTLHTNDAPSSINRLIDMGVDDYMITTTVIGILAQRLVRRLCDHCKEPVNEMPDSLLMTDINKILQGEETHFHKPVGCEVCKGGGYKGRLAITEFMPMTEKTRQEILRKTTSQSLTDVVRAQGMRTLYEDGIYKAAKGLTTIEEVLRVTQTQDA